MQRPDRAPATPARRSQRRKRPHARTRRASGGTGGKLMVGSVVRQNGGNRRSGR